MNRELFEYIKSSLERIDVYLKSGKSMKTVFYSYYNYSLFSESEVDFIAITMKLLDRLVRSKKYRSTERILYHAIILYFLMIKHYSDCYLYKPIIFIKKLLRVTCYYHKYEIVRSELHLLKFFDWTFPITP
jgi:hypothetical protein